MPKPPIEIVLGVASVGDRSRDPTVRYDTPEEVEGFLNAFYERGYRQIDTARSYSPHAPGSSEPRLGAANVGERFQIGTKVLSRPEGAHKKDKVEESINGSLEDLKVSQVDIMYLHAPDRTVPFEETAEAIDKAYREGKFKRFGLSNYTAEEVEQFIKISEERGFVKPTVYQGQYNPIVRTGEKELFPVLRKHGISFYAWSPGAAGFFSGSHKNPQPGSRYDPSHFIGKLYNSWYRKPSTEAAADKVREVAAKHGISGHAASLRWTAHHGVLSAEHGDAIVIGASSIAQLNENLDIFEQGPLPQELVDALNAVAEQIGEDAIPYYF
ncbi:NADP-dependent oxidoreductase domain-containing protein [Trichoderma longibrachiatum]|uniref:Aldo/keto reductase n=1 Tax=Trichoderma longibrachiatum ATCC 18648 TaxID=983965 RepID=A0A2T4BS55_TRILO|nr:Aldo/keto reductase [Trichoderma longibrachiatum ATCC 18648]